MYRNVLFDLDGTLTDPGEGITNSVAYALERFGIINTDRTELYRFIGPPLKDSFMEYYGFSEADSERAIAVYREYYLDKGIFENRLYPGIHELLQGLKGGGRRVILATSKPEAFSVRILDHFGLSRYFDHVAGASLDEKRSKKADVIRYALDGCGIAAAADTVMVGDREHDVLGAKACGLAAIGVLYGYGSRVELTSAGAVRLARTPDELSRILLAE